ncbi:MAG: YggT family protein [Nitrospinae bacterium]|nr:YggT family protein [Nitrospinota bacterium]
MFVFGNFLQAVAMVLSWVLWAYMWVVIGSVIISWVGADPYNPIVRFLHQATEPVFYRVRRYLPMSGWGLDFSPIIVLLAIYFTRVFLIRSLLDLAQRLR